MDKANQWLTLTANLGVIASIVFLGFEVRQNTNIAKASAYRENIQDIAEWRTLTITDPELSQLVATYYHDGVDALDGPGRGRINGWVNNVMGIYENAFFGRRYGIIGDEEWVRFESGACIHFTTAMKNDFNLRYITPRFRQFLEEACEIE